jgi:hypothetical protein
MLTQSQVKWAASHDWFVQDNGDGTICVRDASTTNGVYTETLVRWSRSFRALRDWAGY